MKENKKGRSRVSAVTTALIGILVLAGFGYGAFAAVRALRGHSVGPAPTSPSRTPDTTSSTPPVSPSSRTDRQALGPACLVHELHGDFDGDRLQDVAFTWIPQPAGGCPWNPPFGPFNLTVFRVNGGRRVELQMTDRCDGQECGYLAKTDLNGDGKSEMATVTWTGAADDLYRVFGLVEGKLVAFPVAPPGAKTYPAGAPIELDVGGSALIQSYVTCEKRDTKGGIVLLAHGFVADTDEQGRQRWSHTETAFRFDGRAFTVLYQDPPEAFPPSYDPSRDTSLRKRACWRSPS